MNTCILRSGRIQSFPRLSPPVVSIYTQIAAPSTTRHVTLFQHRKASSTSPKSTSVSSTSRASPSISSLRSPKPQSRVNGPLSTLPADLDLPARQPDQSLPGYLFSVGKTYVKFYKTGGKNIWANLKTSRPIQVQVDKRYNGSLSKAVSDGYIDRHNLQLLKRSWFDLKRVPMFALVFLVFGEFTPLVVMACTAIVPYTCRIPKQITADRVQMEERRQISFRNLTSALPDDATAKDDNFINTLSRMQLIHITWSLGLASKAWDYLGGQYPGLPTFILRRKVSRHVAYLEMDDALIAKAGGINEMTAKEVAIAGVERGINVLHRPERDVRADLERWESSTKSGASIIRLLLSRPNVW